MGLSRLNLQTDFEIRLVRVEMTHRSHIAYCVLRKILQTNSEIATGDGRDTASLIKAVSKKGFKKYFRII